MRGTASPHLLTGLLDHDPAVRTAHRFHRFPSLHHALPSNDETSQPQRADVQAAEGGKRSCGWSDAVPQAKFARLLSSFPSFSFPLSFPGVLQRLIGATI